MKGDDIEKFARHLCEFLDTVSDIPMFEKLVFSVNIKKVNHGKYELTNPRLSVAEEGVIKYVS